jgi:hypothetical protein
MAELGELDKLLWTANHAEAREQNGGNRKVHRGTESGTRGEFTSSEERFA